MKPTLYSESEVQEMIFDARQSQRREINDLQESLQKAIDAVKAHRAIKRGTGGLSFADGLLYNIILGDENEEKQQLDASARHVVPVIASDIAGPAGQKPNPIRD